MSYIIFNSLSEAQDYSRDEAVTRGCSGTTQYWYAITEHPSDGRAAVNIGDDEVEHETVAELPDDWLPVDDSAL